ncbi:MAG: hypothetical protein AcusKO_07920 [Acuticoccus sp.]
MGLQVEKWLVISNCNRLALARCLKQFFPHIAVEEVHLFAFRRAMAEGKINLDAFAKIFANPQIHKVTNGQYVTSLPISHYVPNLFFCGYHPDACNVSVPAEGSSARKPIPSPSGRQHSAICAVAFMKGMPQEDVEALYCEEIYNKAGYFDVWENDRQLEYAKFAEHGVDLTTLFPKWCRAGPFMHTNQHPKVDCIYDTLVAVLRAAGLRFLETPYRPHDDLRGMGAFPIYPEIAERCGVAGTTYFERQGSNRLISLHDYIKRAYRIYENAGRENLQIQQDRWERFERLQTMIG